jgi:hypothetical protein
LAVPPDVAWVTPVAVSESSTIKPALATLPPIIIPIVIAMAIRVQAFIFFSYCDQTKPNESNPRHPAKHPEVSYPAVRKFFGFGIYTLPV